MTPLQRARALDILYILTSIWWDDDVDETLLQLLQLLGYAWDDEAEDWVKVSA